MLTSENNVRGIIREIEQRSPIMSPAYCRRIVRSHPEVACVKPGDDGYLKASALIAEVFSEAYEARCSHFLPFLLSFQTKETLGGAVGFRHASMGELYLEQYLERPVEQEISACYRRPVERGQIVEIGNLVARHAGNGLFMFAVLGTILRLAGISWLVFTATPQVAAMMDHIRLRTFEVCQADPMRLKDTETEWGRYYDSGPKVLVADLADASEFLDDPAVRSMVTPYLDVLKDMAAQLRQGL